MISTIRLARLPRRHRLRKIWKIFSEAEQQLVLTGSTNCDLFYLSELLKLLSEDAEFSPAAISAIKTALSEIQGEYPRRPVNTIRHLLLAETGRSTADWDLLDSAGNLDPAQRRYFPGMMVYLEDIRSPFNIGAMFRTAESFGVEKIYLSPLCADPKHPRAKRTAMGCVEIVPWERIDSPNQTSQPELPLFALETGGTPLADFSFPAQGIMIAGSEELGISPGLLAAADASMGRVSIPLYGVKGSLNVSAAFGIVVQAWAASLA